MVSTGMTLPGRPMDLPRIQFNDLDCWSEGRIGIFGLPLTKQARLLVSALEANW